MARGELLRKLFLSHLRREDDGFRAIALEVIAEEERKNNHRLAKDLRKILENGKPLDMPSPATFERREQLPKDLERQVFLVDVRESDRSFDEILLSEDRKILVKRVLEEFRKSELLRIHGLRPATKLLFCGPPGCGKTLCSEIISAELGLPLLYTRFDAIVSSYLGETAANLRKVFDYASQGRWVVLFDEFDAIGKARDDTTEHGELKRVINSFLQLLDGFSAPSLVIAATNHEQLLDPALWRRFDEVVDFPPPNVHDIRSLLAMKLKNFPRTGIDLKLMASRLKGMSHADIERICLDALKAAILANQDNVDQAVFEEAIKRQQNRQAIILDAHKRR